MSTEPDEFDLLSRLDGVTTKRRNRCLRKKKPLFALLIAASGTLKADGLLGLSASCFRHRRILHGRKAQSGGHRSLASAPSSRKWPGLFVTSLTENVDIGPATRYSKPVVKGVISSDSLLARVYSRLKARQHEHLSGEQLARELALSRNAVWKQVEILRRLGYQVQSSRRLGHRLLSAPDRPLPWEVLDGLTTRRLGRPARFWEVAGSTQDLARRWAEAGAPEGALVVAEEQRFGRGTRGRPYVSPRGGVWFSLVLRPPRPPSDALALSVLGTVALHRAISAAVGLGGVASWPKEVLMGGKRVAAVLVEISAEHDLVRYAILGVGVNVNLPTDSFPPQVRGSATSLLLEVGEPVTMVPFVRRLLEELDSLYDLYLQQGPAAVAEAWRREPNILGHRVTVEEDGVQMAGEAVDIAADCRLLLRLEDGRVVSLSQGRASLSADATP